MIAPGVYLKDISNALVTQNLLTIMLTIALLIEKNCPEFEQISVQKTQ